MSLFRYVFVRHGFSYGNQEHLLAGHTDVPLTDWGRAELRRLRRCCAYPQTQRYYSSDLSRCTETFHILYDGKAELNGLLPQFREINFGDLENKSETDPSAAYFFRRWLQGETIGKAETLPQFQKRIHDALHALTFDLLQNQINSATLVTHCGVIRAVRMLLEQRGPEDFFKIDAPNGLGYILDLEVAGDRLTLLSCRPLMPYPETALPDLC